MLFKIEDGLWFDNERMRIHKGSCPERAQSGTEDKVRTVEARGENWRPTLIYLSATTCNLRCAYCYADGGTYGSLHKKKAFTFDDYAQTYTHMHRLFQGISAVSFFGGEPLINFTEIRKFVEFLHAHYKKEELPSFSINTNATLFTPEILDFFQQYGFVIGTSVDGPKAVHDQNRFGPDRRGTYDTVVQNLDEATRHELNVICQYTFTKQHLDSYEPGSAIGWYGDLERLPITGYDLIPVSTTDKRYRIDLEDANSARTYERFCEETADYYLDKLLHGDISKVPRMFMGLLLRILTRTPHKDCSAGFSFSITPDREVFPCHAFAADANFSIRLDELGTEEDFTRNRWFAQVREANRLRVDKCESCLSRQVCGAWCKALVFSVKGGFNDVLEERCLLMTTYTRKIIRFLAEDYPPKRESIKEKLIAYNRNQMELKSTV